MLCSPDCSAGDWKFSWQPKTFLMRAMRSAVRRCARWVRRDRCGWGCGSSASERSKRRHRHPLIPQQRIQLQVVVGSPVEEGSPEDALLPEADFFRHPAGGGVAGMDRELQPVEAPVGEEEAAEEPEHFRHDPLAMVRRLEELIADLQP